MLKARVRNREMTIIQKWPITSGSVGLPVSFSFDEDWEGLSKIAVFKGSGQTVDVALFEDSCTVPAEVLTEAGENLFVGVYGANGEGTIVIPTIWAKAGHIHPGAEPSETLPSEPTPVFAAQIMEAAKAGSAEFVHDVIAVIDAEVSRIMSEVETLSQDIANAEELGSNVSASLAEAISDANQAVEQAQQSIDGIEAQRDTILQSIADAAELGTDTTLSTPGMAADAKAAGTEIREISNSVFADMNSTGLWAVGAIGSSNGENSMSTTRLRTTGYISAGVKKISVAAGYKYMVFGYSSGTYMGTWNGTSFVKSGNWRTTETDLTALPAYDFRLVMADENIVTLTTADASNVTLLASTDTTLTTSGIAADAKTTGDAVGGLRAEMFNISSNVSVLSDGTDFDTLRDPAVYRISNNTHAATMLNIPQKTSGKLIVCATANVLKVYQIYVTTTSATFMYARQYDGSAWGGWNRILSSYDLTTINNRLAGLEKTIHIKHESGAWTNFTELLYVCIPAYDGYILYKLRHYVREDNNCNCWTIYKAYHVDDNLENEIQLTITAEWECAVHIADRDDFSGGNMHGDEIMQSVSFLVDGAPVDITAFTNYTKCDSLKILRNSILYDPDDHTTAIANHGVEYSFDAESGLRISQSIKWLNSYTLTNCFLAMFPPSKAYIDRASFNSDFEVVELASDVSTSQPVITKNNASGVETWDTSSGFSAKVYTPVYPTGLNGGDRMVVSDNGDEDYNKFYFKVCESQSVPANTVWKSESVYILDYKSS